ncbi:hypothetical protein D9M71_304800 [compost metagenome]
MKQMFTVLVIRLNMPLTMAGTLTRILLYKKLKWMVKQFLLVQVVTFGLIKTTPP